MNVTEHIAFRSEKENLLPKYQLEQDLEHAVNAAKEGTIYDGFWINKNECFMSKGQIDRHLVLSLSWSNDEAENRLKQTLDNFRDRNNIQWVSLSKNEVEALKDKNKYKRTVWGEMSGKNEEE